jgi:hypothetical protein
MQPVSESLVDQGQEERSEAAARMSSSLPETPRTALLLQHPPALPTTAQTNRSKKSAQKDKSAHSTALSQQGESAAEQPNRKYDYYQILFSFVSHNVSQLDLLSAT